MPRNEFMGHQEEPEEAVPEEAVDERMAALQASADAGSTTAQHQLDLLQKYGKRS